MITTRLNQNRWALVARGVVAILFGIAAFFAPQIALAWLVVLVGAYFLVDGVFALIAAFRFAHEHERWFGMLLHGVIGIIAGLYLFFSPGSGLLALLFVAGIWAIVTGVAEFWAGLRLRNHASGEIFLLLAGTLSAIVGFLLLFHPLATALAYMFVLGIYAVIAGVTLLIQASRFGRLGGDGTTGTGAGIGGGSILP